MSDRTLRLFHVDDDEDDRFFVARAARATALPIVVSNAPSGHDALDMLRASMTWPDMLLLDIRMPRMSGFEFLEALKGIGGAKCPVVMYSSSDQEIDVRRAREMGVHAYCVKPTGLEQLVAFIKRLYHAWLRSEPPCEWPVKSKSE